MTAKTFSQEDADMTEKYTYECHGPYVSRFGGTVKADSIDEAARLAVHNVHGSAGSYKPSYIMKVDLTRVRDKVAFSDILVRMILEGGYYVVPSSTLDSFLGVET